MMQNVKIVSMLRSRLQNFNFKIFMSSNVSGNIKVTVHKGSEQKSIKLTIMNTNDHLRSMYEDILRQNN